MPMPLPRRTVPPVRQESMSAPCRQQRALSALRTRIRVPLGPRRVTPACHIPPRLWGARVPVPVCAMLASSGRLAPPSSAQLRQTCVCLVRRARIATCQERRSVSIVWRGSTPARRGQQHALSAHHGRCQRLVQRHVLALRDTRDWDARPVTLGNTEICHCQAVCFARQAPILIYKQQHTAPFA